MYLLLSNALLISETYSEPRQTSKMGLFVRIVRGFRPLIAFVKALS